MFPIYLHEYKITIWWSAKCGCTTIKHIIYNIILKLDIKDIHFEYITFKPEYLNYKNILIVRHPIDRIISCFINRYEVHKEYFKEPHNFKEFIDVLSDKNLVFPDGHHTCPQFSEEFDNLKKYCDVNDINFKFDNVIKLEELNFNNFLNDYFNLNIEENLNINFNKTNKTENYIEKSFLIPKLKFDSIPSYKSFLNEEIIKKIKEIYKIDYENFESYKIIYD